MTDTRRTLPASGSAPVEERGSRPADKAGRHVGTKLEAGRLERLLKGLLHGPGMVAPNGEVLITVEAGGVRRTVRFTSLIRATACRDGLVAQAADRLELTADGRTFLMQRRHADAGFLAQHRPLERETIEGPAGSVEVLVDQAESPLAWLRRRRGRDGEPLIDEVRFQAGERLRADFTRGNLAPRVTANWQAAVASGRRGSGGDLTYSDVVLAARQRVQAAMQAVGPELSGVVLDVCCFLKGLEEVERERGWPARSGKVVLILGLARLAGHYGLASSTRGPDRGRLLSWAAPDARPVNRPGRKGEER